MKKISCIIALVVCMALFVSCGDDFISGLFGSFTGNASSVVGDGEQASYSSSVVVFGDYDSVHYALGLATVLTLEDLLNMDGSEDIQFPFLIYRIVDTGFVAGTTYEVNNTLTNADLVNFDYNSLLEGEYAENQLVGIAVSQTLFYVMNTGTINITNVTNSKMEGSFSGDAYVINTEADPMLSEELVPISGSFSSRVSDVLKWLLQMQENGMEERAAICAR